MSPVVMDIDLYTLIRSPDAPLGIACLSVIYRLKCWRILCLHRKKPCWCCLMATLATPRTQCGGPWNLCAKIDCGHFLSNSIICHSNFGFFSPQKSMRNAHLNNKIWKKVYSQSFYFTIKAQRKKSRSLITRFTKHTRLKSESLKKLSQKTRCKVHLRVEGNFNILVSFLYIFYFCSLFSLFFQQQKVQGRQDK